MSKAIDWLCAGVCYEHYFFETITHILTWTRRANHTYMLSMHKSTARHQHNLFWHFSRSIYLGNMLLTKIFNLWWCALYRNGRTAILTHFDWFLYNFLQFRQYVRVLSILFAPNYGLLIHMDTSYNLLMFDTIQECFNVFVGSPFAIAKNILLCQYSGPNTMFGCWNPWNYSCSLYSHAHITFIFRHFFSISIRIANNSGYFMQHSTKTAFK